MQQISSYRDLRVWQQAMQLSADVYRVTTEFPKHELYGLTNQLRRASVSVPSNIAEGKGHRSDKEFVHFLYHARGSLLEVETQLQLASRLQYLSELQVAELLERSTAVASSLNALINAISRKAKSSARRKPPTSD